jgi:predicted nuclease with RNAse H fold
MLKAVGIDLAASVNRKTGFSVLYEDLSCFSRILYRDKEIIQATVLERPDIVCIDAPLFFPSGKKSFRKIGPPHLRECDRVLLRMGIKFFPITLGPMRSLTLRGIRLKRALVSEGIRVFESFPGAVQDLLGIPRKNRSLFLMESALRSLGLKISQEEGKLDGDQMDAITMSVVGMMYLWGHGRLIGREDEGFMLIPDINL